MKHQTRIQEPKTNQESKGEQKGPGRSGQSSGHKVLCLEIEKCQKKKSKKSGRKNLKTKILEKKNSRQRHTIGLTDLLMP